MLFWTEVGFRLSRSHWLKIEQFRNFSNRMNTTIFNGCIFFSLWRGKSMKSENWFYIHNHCKLLRFESSKFTFNSYRNITSNGIAGNNSRNGWAIRNVKWYTNQTNERANERNHNPCNEKWFHCYYLFDSVRWASISCAIMRFLFTDNCNCSDAIWHRLAGFIWVTG